MTLRKLLFWLLLPLTALYGLIVFLRNTLYDWKIFKSTAFRTANIVVGNIKAGGVGKTPLIEYLIELLQTHYKVATLSRGYMRRTKGYVLADENSTPLDIGDEPVQIKHRFPQTVVSVCEKRVEGLRQLEILQPGPSVVLLDDAHQHRALKAGLYILVTEFDHLFTDDFLLPSGRLREPRRGYKRAQIIVVSKCPRNLTYEERQRIIRKVKPLAHQTIVFAAYTFGEFKDIFNHQPIPYSRDTAVLLVTGIADNTRMKTYIEQHFSHHNVLSFADHHNYTAKDLSRMIELYRQLSGSNRLILTTDKDAVKLRPFAAMFNTVGVRVATQPMYVTFINNDKSIFDASIFNYLNHALPTGYNK